MTLFDLFVVAVMALSVLFGAARGLTREAITLLGLGGGIVFVALFAAPLGGLFGDRVVAVGVVIAVLFLVGFSLVHVGLELAARKLIGAKPYKVDRISGGIFGIFRGWFICGLTFLAATYYFEAAALPETLGKAWTRGFAASGARVLDGLGIAGDSAQDASAESPDADIWPTLS